MYEKKYCVDLTGIRDSLMHGYNVESQESLKTWRGHPDNAKLSVKGDDRSPAFTWLSYVYHDDNVVGWPSDNIMTMIRDGASKIPLPGGKSNETFKKPSQSGILVNEILWPILVSGSTIPWKKLSALDGQLEFDNHKNVAEKLGFELFVKPAKIGTSKHIRVRPRFCNWTCSGTITVFDERIKKDIVELIFNCAGRYIGLSDWRPGSSKSPGPFGVFTSKITEIK